MYISKYNKRDGKHNNKVMLFFLYSMPLTTND